MAQPMILGKRYENNNEYFLHPLKLGPVEMIQVGELYCEADYQVKPHYQSSIEISYIVTGDCTFITGDIKSILHQGDVYINRPGKVHTIIANQGTPLRYFYFSFNFCENAEAEFGKNLCNFFRNGFPFILRDNKELLYDFPKVFYEIQTKDNFFEQMLTICVKRLIIDTYRYFQMGDLPKRNISFDENMIGSAVYTVVRYIDQNYREISDIRTVSKELGYSYSYLAHVFKEKMDMTIGEYIIKKKMDEGKSLLEMGRMNVTQVSESLNYLSVQSFSKSFRKLYGISPIEFIRQLHQQVNAG